MHKCREVAYPERGNLGGVRQRSIRRQSQQRGRHRDSSERGLNRRRGRERLHVGNYGEGGVRLNSCYASPFLSSVGFGRLLGHIEASTAGHRRTGVDVIIAGNFNAYSTV